MNMAKVIGGKSIPTIQIVGPAGKLRINTSDWPHWEKRGYKYADGERGMNLGSIEESAPAKNPAVEFHWDSLTVAELREHAEANDLEIPSGINKSEIIAFIVEAELDPPSAE